MKRDCLRNLTPAVLGACAVLGLSGEAKAAKPDPPPTEACKIALSIPASVFFRGAQSRGYEVFSDLRHLERFQVVVQHQGGPCDFVLVPYAPSGGRLAGGSGDVLSYALKEDAGGRNILAVDPSGSSETQIRGRFPGGAASEVYEFYVEVPPRQFASGGIYSDTVLFRAYDDDGGLLVLKDEKGVGVATEVPSEVQAGVGASANGPRDQSVNLGQLVSGLSRTLGFTARSNTPFEISFSSEHSGSLKHEFSSATVPYSVRFRGQTVGLSAGPVVALSETRVGEAAQYDFDVQIGTVSPRTPAGRYADTLTVTITTL